MFRSMRRKVKDFKASKRRQFRSGQAFVEFVLVLGLLLLIGIGLFTGVRQSISISWQETQRAISAACADCPVRPANN
jgi:hypothetical protein